jgi:hypothetical protein
MLDRRRQRYKSGKEKVERGRGMTIGWGNERNRKERRE